MLTAFDQIKNMGGFFKNFDKYRSKNLLYALKFAPKMELFLPLKYRESLFFSLVYDCNRGEKFWFKTAIFKLKCGFRPLFIQLQQLMLRPLL
jgi:hypothetical protein